MAVYQDSHHHSSDSRKANKGKGDEILMDKLTIFNNRTDDESLEIEMDTLTIFNSKSDDESLEEDEEVEDD